MERFKKLVEARLADEIVFTCSLCGAKYPALDPEPRIPEDNLYPHAILREAFYHAAGVLMSLPIEKVDEKAVKRAEKAAMTYFQAVRYTGVKRVPDTLVSSGPEHRLQCAGGCNGTRQKADR
jgi:hypothetical protein